MKPVKNFLFAVLLVSLMAVTTPAGEQDTPGAVCVPTVTNSCSAQVADEPETDKTEIIITPEMTDYLLYKALVALLSMY
jgi:hypothetical protein